MINVVLRGHGFEYEVGELIKVFGLWRDIKFVDDYKIGKDGLFLINEAIDQGRKYLISTKIYENSNLVSVEEGSYKIEGNKGNIEKRKKLKRKVKASIFDALMKFSKCDIPWGILTGIRPTKIIHELLDSKYNIEEIKGILKEEYRIRDEKINLMLDIALRERKYIYPIDEELVSLYISIPFCPTRCLYCSFPSNPMKEGNKKVDEYLRSLSIEIIKMGKLLGQLGKKLESIYIGGGTPTTLSSMQLDTLINWIFEAFDISRLKEFTVEAGRPDTIDRDKLKVLKLNGVNRISINPQTMNPKTLSLIGRKHSQHDIDRAFYEAKEIGFDTINMDVIIGLPKEGIDEVRNTLQIIKGFSPENLTVHTLAIKRSSRLNQSLDDFQMAKETLAKEMLNLTKNYAYEMGLYPYYMYRQKYMVGNLENLGYCKKNHECIYNMQIMEEKQSIVALGAGGISKIVFPSDNRLERVPNVKNVDEYIKRVEEMVDRKRVELTKYTSF
ncbi:MAG: coproporphyrinogen dehydrogenase HemZ [Clostridia bacterium]|nr:coproporphyrinogen dehydrogenase HemZ [Clostridia bacterium]